MYKHFFKRLIDILVSLIALPFVFLTIIIFGPIIFFTDKGPIFYCGERLGKNGKTFKMIKFRSMKVNAPDIRLEDGSTYNSENDPRVTKIGKFLRKTSIDELPQFLNVFVGHMSIIGPRPHLSTNYTNFSELSDKKQKRLKVRPGLTGYSQAYFRNSISAEKKIENDCFYVDNISFVFDTKIFIQTIKSVLIRKNVYISNDNLKSNDSTQAKKVLILGASFLQLPAIKKAKEFGYYVGVIDYNSNAIGIPYADVFYNKSTNDIEGVIAIAKEFKPDGIMTTATDMPMRSIAAACNELNIPNISIDTALKATDKGEMIKAFDNNRVEHPWFYIIKSENEINELKEKISFPCILKPTDNAGSRGVVLINSFDDLFQQYSYAKKESRKGNVIIEEYLIGPEFSVEILVIDSEPRVLQITDKLTTGAPHFVEMGHSQPTLQPHIVREQISDLACRAVKAVGINIGPAHVEIILTKTGPKMVELGSRMGGDCITSHLVPLSTGIDMIGLAIKQACGEKIAIRPTINKGSAIRFITGKSGVIKSIEGIDKAKKIRGIQDVFISAKIGDIIGDMNSSSDRLGYVIAQHKNAKKAIAVCEKALKLISIIIE